MHYRHEFDTNRIWLKSALDIASESRFIRVLRARGFAKALARVVDTSLLHLLSGQGVCESEHNEQFAVNRNYFRLTGTDTRLTVLDWALSVTVG